MYKRQEEDTAEIKLYTRADVNARKDGAEKETAAADTDSVSTAITNGLGGRKNISDVDCCATRLRCTVKRPELVNDALLKSTGASGVVHKGNGVQVIYGPHVTVIKSNLEDYLETAPNEEYTGGEQEAAVDTVVSEEKQEKEQDGEKKVKTIVISSPVTGKAADLSLIHI